jgi:hypothetical protein
LGLWVAACDRLAHQGLDKLDDKLLWDTSLRETPFWSEPSNN